MHKSGLLLFFVFFLFSCANEDAEIAYLKGLDRIKAQSYEEAIQEFTKAIDANPTYAEAYYQRGDAKYRLAKHREALKDLDIAIDLNPKYIEAYNRRAELKFVLNDVNGSLGDINKSIELSPDNADLYYNRGLLRNLKLNDKEGAIQDWRKASSLGHTEAAKAIQDLEARSNILDD